MDRGIECRHIDQLRIAVMPALGRWVLQQRLPAQCINRLQRLDLEDFPLGSGCLRGKTTAPTLSAETLP